MTRRWILWTGGALLVALFTLFPLRMALGMSDLEHIGFTARQVAGTIWYGRVGDLQLRSQPLGTFEVRLDPGALLLGDLSMRMDRMDDPDGLLTGRMVAGLRRGVKGANGRIAIASMLAPLPIEALELKDATLLFRNGYCVESGGSVTPLLTPSVASLGLGAEATGELRCDGKRARVAMRSAPGNARFDFYVDASGAYRAWITISGSPPETSAALTMLGFRSSPDGLIVATEGRL